MRHRRGYGLCAASRTRPFADRIATWADRYNPPEEEREERLGHYHYLGPDYAFLEKFLGAAPFLKDIRCFGIGASTNAMYVAVPKLAAGVTRSLFAAELEHHWDGLQAYSESQVMLRDDD